MNPIEFNFENESLEVFQKDGQIFFNAEQAAIGLGIYQLKSNRKYVRWERVQKYLNSPHVGKGEYISEPQFYTLAIKADNQVARKFQHWVTSEVLPAIRKHGAYMTDQKAFDVTHNAQGLADLLQQAADQLKQKDIQIKEMKPKALFADAVSTAKTNILIGEMAKILKANGVDYITVGGQKVTMGQNHFFQWLRENGYLIKRRGTDYNAPTQKAMNKGLFRVKESVNTDANGTTQIRKTTKITGIGQRYFINYFLAA